MRILILGAGAVGCVIASALAQAGVNVALYARGEHGRKLRENGIVLETPDGTTIQKPQIILEGEEIGEADYTFLCVKSYQYPDIADFVPKNSYVIPIGNGVPWWFGGGKYDLDLLDGDRILAEIPRKKIIGGLTYAAATVAEPGKVVNLAPRARLFVGDVDLKENAAVKKISDVLEVAGFKNNYTQNIKGEIWRKLAWNISFNVLSVIYKMDSGTLAENAETSSLIYKIISEMQILADLLKLGIVIDADKHVEIGRNAGRHKPSMLQDFEAGRRMEKDAVLLAPIKIADVLGADIPVIRQIAERFP